LEKGIGIHHSKMISILREIVEILFAKGKIKLLFCTTSVAIGLNLPVKTSIFTDIYKHDGSSLGVLAGHEYVQAAGRAGRLGLDTVGHVIHLNNLFRFVDTTSYKTMLKGKPQVIVSKFKVSFNLLLNFVSTDALDFSVFAKKSMTQDDVFKQLQQLDKEKQYTQSILKALEEEVQKLKTPLDVIQRYSDLLFKRSHSVNKHKREAEKEIQTILQNYPFVQLEQSVSHKYQCAITENDKSDQNYKDVETFIDNNIGNVLYLLETGGFVLQNENGKYTLSEKGFIASNIREVHCLAFANLFEDKVINQLSSIQLVSLFSCFTNLKVSDEIKAQRAGSSDKTLCSILVKLVEMIQYFGDKETEMCINTGVEKEFHYDLLPYMADWCKCEQPDECKYLIQTMAAEHDICLGEFVKCLLKIVNISNEFERIAELIGDVEFLSKLCEVPKLILKFVVTPQSLYV